jgi:hypothetical protein
LNGGYLYKVQRKKQQPKKWFAQHCLGKKLKKEGKHEEQVEFPNQID